MAVLACLLDLGAAAARPCPAVIEEVRVARDVAEAQSLARAAVAARVRSTIDGRSVRAVSEQLGGDDAGVVERWSSITEVHHTFAHGELIELQTVETAEGYAATARLVRASAARHVAALAADERARLDAALVALRAGPNRCPDGGWSALDGALDGALDAELLRASLTCRPPDVAWVVDARARVSAARRRQASTPWVWRGPPALFDAASAAWRAAGAAPLVRSAPPASAVAVQVTVDDQTSVHADGLTWADSTARLTLVDGERALESPSTWSARQPGVDAETARRRARALLADRAARPLAVAASAAACAADDAPGHPDAARAARRPQPLVLIYAPRRAADRLTVQAVIDGRAEVSRVDGPAPLALYLRDHHAPDARRRRTTATLLNTESGQVVRAAEHICCGCTADGHSRGLPALVIRALGGRAGAPPGWATGRSHAVTGAPEALRAEVEAALVAAGGRIEPTGTPLSVEARCEDEGRSSTGQVARVACRGALDGDGRAVVARQAGFDRTPVGARRRALRRLVARLLERFGRVCPDHSTAAEAGSHAP